MSVYTGVSYFGNRIPRHFREIDLPELQRANCTFVLHTFSEYDVRFYGDSVAAMVQASHDAGLEVYVDPWGVGGVFGGEAFSRFLLDHRDAWQIKGDGTPVPMACLNAPAFVDHMRAWIEAAAAMAPDVLFWDEPQLYAPERLAAGSADWTCRCATCQGLFTQAYGRPMPAEVDDDVMAFREWTAVSFIERVCREGAARGLRNAVCLRPYADAEHGIAHWDRVAAIDGLDILSVTPFWHLWGHDVASFVGQWSRTVVELCERFGKEPQIWLQGFMIDAGREGELRVGADAAFDAGVRNFAAWGFQACDHMGWLRPANPALVWQTIGDVFGELRERGAVS